MKLWLTATEREKTSNGRIHTYRNRGPAPNEGRTFTHQVPRGVWRRISIIEQAVSVSGIAWRLQAKVEGNLSERARRRASLRNWEDFAGFAGHESDDRKLSEEPIPLASAMRLKQWLLVVGWVLEPSVTAPPFENFGCDADAVIANLQSE